MDTVSNIIKPFQPIYQWANQNRAYLMGMGLCLFSGACLASAFEGRRIHKAKVITFVVLAIIGIRFIAIGQKLALTPTTHRERRLFCIQRFGNSILITQTPVTIISYPENP